jgi:hypothetical protein
MVLWAQMFFFTQLGKGQDVHYTQWWMSDGFVAPAQIHAEHDILIQAGMKSQWNGVSGVPFQLQNVHADWRLPKWPSWSIQGAYLKDKGGDGSWLQSKWNLGLGWRYGGDTSDFVMNSVLLFRGGGSRWNNSAWQFMDDWNGLYHQENIGQTEYFNQTHAMGWAWSNAVRWTWFNEMQCAVGFTHFSSMQYRFKDDSDAYEWSSQQMLFGNLKMKLTEAHPIQAYCLFQKQKQHHAWLGYGEWGTLLDERSWMRTTLWLGGGWRWGDALIAGTGMSWGGHLLRLTYDINLSPFRIATEYRGGWEIQYQFHFLNPKSPRKMKPVCPAYY